MSLALYMDHNVRLEITAGLRTRGVDVVTAFEDRAHRLPDEKLLDRSTALGRVLVTHDDDFLVETAARLRRGDHFAGVIYGHQLEVTIGACIEELDLMARIYEPSEMHNTVHYLPL